MISKGHILRTFPDKQAGMTLVEVLVAAAIVAVVTSGAVVSYNLVKKSQVRSAASKLAGLMRYAHNRARSSGQVFRLRLDMERQEYLLERSDLPFYLSKNALSPENPASAASNEEETDPFLPKRPAFAPVKDSMLPSRISQKDIRIKSIQTSQQSEVRASGMGYVYFFPDLPSGSAWICVGRNDGSQDYGLWWQSRTGKVQMLPDCQNPPRLEEPL